MNLLPFLSGSTIGLPIWAMGSAEPVRILLIDDDDDEATLTRSLLGRVEDIRYELDWVATYGEGLAAIADGGHDAYLIDHQLGGRTGIDLVREARSAGSLAALIMMTGQRDRTTDMAAMNAGATDFLMKGRTDAALLDRTLRYAISQSAVVSALEHTHNQMAGLEELGRILVDDGPTPETMTRVVDLIVERFSLPRVAIYLAEGEYLHLAGQRGYEDPLTTLSRDDSSVDRVARARQPVFVPSLSHEHEEGGTNSDVATELSVPLLVAGELAGLLNVASLVASPIGEQDVAAIRLVAERLTAALEIVRDRRVSDERLRKARQQLADPQAFVDGETLAYRRPLLEPLIDVAIASATTKAGRNFGLLIVACEETGPGAVTPLAAQANVIFGNRPRVRFARNEIAVLLVATDEAGARAEAQDLLALTEAVGLDAWCGYAAFTPGWAAADLIAAAQADLALTRRVAPPGIAAA
jgi:FixJ family two-component response regulator